MVQIDQQVIDQRDTANKKVQYLTQSNNQKDREIERKDRKIKSLNLEKEQLRKQVSERDQTIQDLTSINYHVNQENKKLKSQD